MADVSKKPVRIIMWCLPRSISSALAKCLSAIDGMEIWFESFSYCGIGRYQYQLHHQQDLPMEYEGNEEAMLKASEYVNQLTNSTTIPERFSYANVKQSLETTTSKYVFVKDMAFVMLDAKSRQHIPSGYKHAFLIREPTRMFNSYRRALYKQLLDVGVLEGDAKDEMKFDLEKHDIALPFKTFYSGLRDLWKYVCENIDPNPVVMNADDLLLKPAEILSKFCEQTGLPYSDSLLKWDASTDVLNTWKAAGDSLLFDVVPFYNTAMKSSYFMPPNESIPRDQLSDDLKILCDAAMPYFNEVNEHKM